MSALNRENRVTHLFIADNIARTSNVTLSTLAAGEVVIAAPGGTILTGTTAATAEKLVIYQGRGAGKAPLKSPVINRKAIKRYAGYTWVNDVEQIDYIGYNGTTGSINAINDNLYMIRLELRGIDSLTFKRQDILDIPYKSDSSATQIEIVDGLVSAGIKTIERNADKPIAIERVCNDAGAAITGAPTAWSATKGSKYVTYTGTDPSNLVVGDYLRLGGTTTVTPVYKVAAIDTVNNVVTLDLPYQGDSFTASANANHEVVAASSAAAANWGIKLTGRPLQFDETKPFPFRKAAFKTTLLESFGTTTVTEAQGSNPGRGNWEQIAELERHCQGNEGNLYRSEANSPAPIMRKDVKDTTSYAVLVLEYEIETTEGLGANVKSPATVIIALDRGGVAGTATFGAQVGAGNSTTNTILDCLTAASGTTVLATSIQ
jgi:hypothetical protein